MFSSLIFSSLPTFLYLIVFIGALTGKVENRKMVVGLAAVFFIASIIAIFQLTVWIVLLF